MSHRRETSSDDAGRLKNVYHSIYEKSFFVRAVPSLARLSLFFPLAEPENPKENTKYQQSLAIQIQKAKTSRKKEDKRESRGMRQRKKKYYESKSQRRVALPTKKKPSSTERRLKNFNSFALISLLVVLLCRGA
jgi:hypothetical protein